MFEFQSSKDGVKPNYQTYVVYVKDGNRDSLINHMKEKGIEAGIGTYSIPHINFYTKKYGFSEFDFHNSRIAYETLMSLPLFEGITTSEQDRVIEAIGSFKLKKVNTTDHSAVNIS